MNRLRYRAFTLIELLVVVSIIALLIAILLPALRSARNAAVVAEDMSNARQVATGILAYAVDMDGFYPRFHFLDTGPDDYARSNTAAWRELEENYGVIPEVQRCITLYDTDNRGNDWVPQTRGRDDDNNPIDSESGWNVWVGRFNGQRVDDNGGVRYDAPQSIEEVPDNSSETMLVCHHFLTNTFFNTHFPHIPTDWSRRARYFRHVPGDEVDLTEGLVVTRRDGSTLFSPIEDMVASQVQNGNIWNFYLPD